LLFLCQTLPYPPDGGVWIRTYHVMRLLAQVFDISALCFERSGSAGQSTDTEASLDALRAFGDVEVFALPQRHSRSRFIRDHARSVFRQEVYTRFLYDSTPFRRRLMERLGATRFDLVHADSLDLAQYLPACKTLPISVVHHDVESDLLQRRSDVQAHGWKRAYFRHQSRLMRSVEVRWCPAVTVNIVCSDRDGARLQEIAPGSRVLVVPNGVDVNEFQPDARTDVSGIAFVGGAQPAPNLDALEYFCGSVLPHLRQPGVAHEPVRWIGRASLEQQQHYRYRFGVDLTGYVDDPRPLMQAAAVHIVPIRVGGGTRLKILNAWAMGKPVVSTSIGCEGLAAVDGENILIRDEPHAFAAAIAEVLGSPALAARLGRGGRETVIRRYDWTAVGAGMVEHYLRLANARAGVLTPAESTMSYVAPCRP
jgi:glycosyltransferase involved in cell wall biosynthesis